jgi:hypothetical protein
VVKILVKPLVVEQQFEWVTLNPEEVRVATVPSNIHSGYSCGQVSVVVRKLVDEEGVLGEVCPEHGRTRVRGGLYELQIFREDLITGFLANFSRGRRPCSLSTVALSADETEQVPISAPFPREQGHRLAHSTVKAV